MPAQVRRKSVFYARNNALLRGRHSLGEAFSQSTGCQSETYFGYGFLTSLNSLSLQLSHLCKSKSGLSRIIVLPMLYFMVCRRSLTQICVTIPFWWGSTVKSTHNQFFFITKLRHLLFMRKPKRAQLREVGYNYNHKKPVVNNFLLPLNTTFSENGVVLAAQKKKGGHISVFLHE